MSDQERVSERCVCGGEWVDFCDGESEWTECADCETVKSRPPTPVVDTDDVDEGERCHLCKRERDPMQLFHGDGKPPFSCVDEGGCRLYLASEASTLRTELERVTRAAPVPAHHPIHRCRKCGWVEFAAAGNYCTNCHEADLLDVLKPDLYEQKQMIRAADVLPDTNDHPERVISAEAVQELVEWIESYEARCRARAKESSTLAGHGQYTGQAGTAKAIRTRLSSLLEGNPR